MTSETGPQEPGEDQAAPSPAPDTDWFLQVLVGDANERGEGLQVTLLLGGTIVTGVLASKTSYFENFADELEQSFAAPSEAASAYVDNFRGIAREYAARGETLASPPRFIHLRDASIIVPGQAPIPENRKVWWRGRIAEVDGFMLGVLGRPR